jgi:hypothetical protein
MGTQSIQVEWLVRNHWMTKLVYGRQKIQATIKYQINAFNSKQNTR